MVAANRFVESEGVSGLCAMCGVPLDSQYFDESRIADTPATGNEVVLARFQLPSQYCGILEYFSQFTDAQARDRSQIVTPGLEWLLLSNGRPLFPYLKLDRILNPWGYGSFQVAIRLEPGATVELIVRGVSDDGHGSRLGRPRMAEEFGIAEVPLMDRSINQVGGRIVGRYWYDAAYGDVVRRKS
jgi:hypothetical protein